MTNQWNQNNAKIWIETGHEGPLAAHGHDLLFECRSFSLTYDLNTKKAEGVIDVEHIELVGALKNGQLVVDELKPGGREVKVKKTLQTKVLDQSKYPQVKFVGTCETLADGAQITGEVELTGKKGTINTTLNKGIADGENTFEVAFDIIQSEYGIKPFAILMGALRVKDRVQVRVELNAK